MAKKIMIVDDDLDVVTMVGLMFERQGYKIIAAKSGAQALAKAQAETPDAIILDIMMPDMDGYEVCRQLRANPATANLPILMFTAKTTMKDKVAGFQAGADDYLTKPIHPTELSARVETALLRSARKPVTGRLPMRAKVLGFIGAKGGVGTTTLAVNVAVVLAQELARGKQVVLADMQSGIGAIALQMELRQGGMARLLSQPVESIELETVEAQLEEHRTGVRVLSGQIEPPGVAPSVSQAHAKVVIQDMGAAADWLLLDLGIGLGEATRHILPICHRVVVAIEPQRVTLTLAKALLSEMTRLLNLPRHRVVLVMMNKAPSGASFAKDAVEGLLQHDLIGVVTPASELALQSSERATPMVMLQPDSLVARQFRTIAEYLITA